MFSVFTTYVAFVALCFVMQTEVYAALKACQYAIKFKETTRRLQVRIAFERYKFLSILFHAGSTSRPGYEFSSAALAGLATAAVLDAFRVVNEIGIAVVPHLSIMLSAKYGFLVAVGYFAATQGKAFLETRKDVSSQMHAGTWLVYK